MVAENFAVGPIWQAVFDGVDCGLLVLSEPQQVIVEVNAAICAAWQIPRDELLGLRLSHVVELTGLKERPTSARGRLLRGPISGREVECRLQQLEGSLRASVAIFGSWNATGLGGAALRQDSTTLLPNREFLEEELARRLAAGKRDRRPFALLFLDLDGFKQVNDSRGHLAGDDLLREVGRRLAECVRDNDVVARYGGDEFVVLAEEVSTARDAARVAKRIAAAIERPIALADAKARGGFAEVRLGASIGLALAGNGATPRELLEVADRDMYRRKRRRRRRTQAVEVN